jgi:hypothetical protein
VIHVKRVNSAPQGFVLMDLVKGRVEEWFVLTTINIHLDFTVLKRLRYLALIRRLDIHVMRRRLANLGLLVILIPMYDLEV